MMTRNTLSRSLVAALGALALTASISYISATIPNNPDLTQATAVAFAPIGFVVSATDDLAGLVGNFIGNAAGISNIPLGLGNAPLAVPVVSLWTDGNFNFDLATLNVDFRSTTQLNLSGTGTLTAPGYDPTPGTWTYVMTGSGPVLGFAAGTSTVPDAGSSLALLGLGLVGFAFARRK
jgi:hypothetical protein